MKKIIPLMLLIVGCSKNISCTYENSIVTINENKNKIKTILVEQTFKNEEEMQNYCTLLTLTNVKAECKNKIIKYNDYKDVLNREYLYTDELVNFLESNNYICK